MKEVHFDRAKKAPFYPKYSRYIQINELRVGEVSVIIRAPWGPRLPPKTFSESKGISHQQSKRWIVGSRATHFLDRDMEGQRTNSTLPSSTYTRKELLFLKYPVLFLERRPQFYHEGICYAKCIASVKATASN